LVLGRRNIRPSGLTLKERSAFAKGAGREEVGPEKTSVLIVVFIYKIKLASSL